MVLGPSVGTLAWAQRTGGELRRIDRFVLLWQALITKVAALRPVRRELLRAGGAGELRLPESALSHRVEEIVTAVSEPWFVNHCLRTYMWGLVFGRAAGMRFDEEALFVASMLHDLGLTSGGAKLSPVPARCFAVEGAFAARDLLAREGVAAERCDQVAEAVSLHLNVSVPRRFGVEAHLLHEGAAADVIGSRIEELDERFREDIIRDYPRLDMKAELEAVMKQQARTRPRSRAAFLCSFGFIRLIRKAPFRS